MKRKYHFSPDLHITLDIKSYNDFNAVKDYKSKIKALKDFAKKQGIKIKVNPHYQGYYEQKGVVYYIN